MYSSRELGKRYTWLRLFRELSTSIFQTFHPGKILMEDIFYSLTCVSLNFSLRPMLVLHRLRPVLFLILLLLFVQPGLPLSSPCPSLSTFGRNCIIHLKSIGETKASALIL